MEQQEYFLVGYTFPAPFVGEQETTYMISTSAEEALRDWSNKFGTLGLYSARAFASADDYHKKEKELAKWWSNRCILEDEKQDFSNLDSEFLKKGRIV